MAALRRSIGPVPVVGTFGHYGRIRQPSAAPPALPSGGVFSLSYTERRALDFRRTAF